MALRRKEDKSESQWGFFSSLERPELLKPPFDPTK